MYKVQIYKILRFSYPSYISDERGEKMFEQWWKAVWCLMTGH